MSDPSLSRPPFTPPGTFRCCICFDIVTVVDAFKDEDGTLWDMCQSCGDDEARALERDGEA